MPTSEAGLAERRCMAAIEEAVQSAAGVAVDFKAARKRELEALVPSRPSAFALALERQVRKPPR